MSEWWHGTYGGYTNHHCRCDACRAANTAYFVARRAKFRAERINNEHPRAPHGTYGGYRNWTCRCPLCRRAKADYQRTLRARSAS